ncbi:GNAT family N-acetyltransferase [Hymenobacter busanensis]|nr:GNAT family N-acetyltransferase [Hymenobacter busanensis]QHJ07070.1 GNAT family N-acetyltransferase [Hymenobacter busanensis]
MDFRIAHEPAEQTFSVVGQDAELSYARPANGVVDFQHTYVDESLRGQGVGDQLAKQALEWARHEQLRVRTSCPFVQAYVQRHRAQYQDLLES